MNVLDFAMEVERSERDLYKELAKRAEREGIRAIYSRMAEDEEKILMSLQAMSDSGGDAESRVLEGLEHPFEPREMERVRAEDDLEAYRHLIAMEARMRDFYEEAARRESNALARNLLLKIAAEEERERQSLEAIYEFVNAPNEYLAWSEFSNLDEFHNFGRYEDNRRCRHTS